MGTVLEINNITKRYGSLTAVDNLSISVGQGSIFGILGPNGSGKTTTIAVVLDILKADSGIYSWFGNPPSHKNRQRLGAFIESPNFYPYLSATDNLKIVAAIKQVDKKSIDEVLSLTGLFKRRNSNFSTYSLGMKQRLALASALLGNPDVLVLDEPTNGLDPQGIVEIRNLIIEIGQQGKTIILASHLLDEVEKVCTHVAILKKGNLLTAGSVHDILSDDDQIELAAENLASLESAIRAFGDLKSLKKVDNQLVVKFGVPVKPQELNKFLFDKGITLSYLNLKKKTLENQFIELIGNDD